MAKKAPKKAPIKTEESPSTPEAPAVEPKVESSLLSRIILGVSVAVFAIFMVFTVLLFKSGDEIHWKRELTDIERLHERGRYEEAAARLFQFGRDRPGAQQTFNWNRQMGEYHADAGDWETSARFYERALQLRPTEPGINALAGEAFWMAGNKARAMEFLNKEIEEINPALGDHDRAFFYRGLAFFEEGDYRRTLQSFASISKMEDWAEKVGPIREQIDEEIIEPARRIAAQSGD